MSGRELGVSYRKRARDRARPLPLPDRARAAATPRLYVAELRRRRRSKEGFIRNVDGAFCGQRHITRKIAGVAAVIKARHEAIPACELGGDGSVDVVEL